MKGDIQAVCVLMKQDGKVYEVAIPARLKRDIVAVVASAIPSGLEFFYDPFPELDIVPQKFAEDHSLVFKQTK